MTLGCPPPGRDAGEGAALRMPAGIDACDAGRTLVRAFGSCLACERVHVACLRVCAEVPLPALLTCRLQTAPASGTASSRALYVSFVADGALTCLLGRPCAPTAPLLLHAVVLAGTMAQPTAATPLLAGCNNADGSPPECDPCPVTFAKRRRQLLVAGEGRREGGRCHGKFTAEREMQGGGPPLYHPFQASMRRPGTLALLLTTLTPLLVQATTTTRLASQASSWAPAQRAAMSAGASWRATQPATSEAGRMDFVTAVTRGGCSVVMLVCGHQPKAWNPCPAAGGAAGAG